MANGLGLSVSCAVVFGFRFQQSSKRVCTTIGLSEGRSMQFLLSAYNYPNLLLIFSDSFSAEVVDYCITKDRNDTIL